MTHRPPSDRNPAGRPVVPTAVALLAPVILAPLLAPGDAADAAAQEAPAPDPGTLFLHPERFELEDGSYGEVERGLLFVPADRSRPDAGVVAVVFHRFPADPGADADAPPIFRLHGGPGFGGLELEDPGDYFEPQVEPYTRFTDVVVVGQRGFGPSMPDTGCEGVEAPIFDPAVPEEARARALREASRKCREWWRERGLPLGGLNAREAAADVVDVADALRYDRITLWGVSFGSHWAMAILRYHPERVARALLGGMEGPDHTYDMPTGILNALRRVAEDAEAAPELAPWIPGGGLVDALRETIRRVEREPVDVPVKDPDSGEERTATITADILRAVADGYSSVPDSLHDMAAWPADVLRLHAGRFDAIAERALPGDGDGWRRIPNAAFFMLDCASGITDERRETLLSDPAMEVVGHTAWIYEAGCPPWDADLGDAFRTGFETDVPALIVHGDWDLSTPYENAVELAPAFRNGTLVTVERGTHGALEEAMAASDPFREAVVRFLRTGAMSGIPERVELPPVDWVVPGELEAARR